MNSESEEATPEELEQRSKWFENYKDKIINHSVHTEPQAGVAYRCPCCGYKTLDARGKYQICPVCFWEDDGQDDEDADTVRGGPNDSASLTQARINFKKFGASLKRRTKYVRAPLPEEM